MGGLLSGAFGLVLDNVNIVDPELITPRIVPVGCMSTCGSVG